jgi:hypothetical protein
MYSRGITMVKDSKVYSYAQLSEMIQTSRHKEVKLCNNTVAHVIDDGRIGIRLHYTDVVIINPDDTYELHTKGYTTATTKDRLNGFSPARVIQKQFTFYVLKDPSMRAIKSNLVEFEEGITVDRFGCLSVTA